MPFGEGEEEEELGEEANPPPRINIGTQEASSVCGKPYALHPTRKRRA